MFYDLHYKTYIVLDQTCNEFYLNEITHTICGGLEFSNSNFFNNNKNCNASIVVCLREREKKTHTQT